MKYIEIFYPEVFLSLFRNGVTKSGTVNFIYNLSVNILKKKEVLISELENKLPVNYKENSLRNYLKKHDYISTENLTEIICFIIDPLKEIPKTKPSDKSEDLNINHSLLTLQKIFAHFNKLQLKEIDLEHNCRKGFNELLRKLTKDNHPFGLISIDENWNIVGEKCKPIAEIENYIIQLADNTKNNEDYINTEEHEEPNDNADDYSRKKHSKITIIIVLIVLVLGFLGWNQYKKNKKIDQQIEYNVSVANTYYSTEQYNEALSEYKNVLKTFTKSDLGDYKPRLMFLIGTTLQTTNREMNPNKINESIIYFKNALKEFDKGSDLYNLACLQLGVAYDGLYIITPDTQYLEIYKNYLDSIKSDNIIIQGLKYFSEGNLWAIKNNFGQALTNFNKALSVFNKDNEPESFYAINAEKAFVLTERFHKTEDYSALSMAKNIYADLYKNAKSQFNKMQGEYGLGHCIYHQYFIDNELEKLYTSKDYIQNTLRTVNLKNYPEKYGQIHAMLSKINFEIYFLKEKDTTLLNEVVKSVDESLKFYTSEFISDQYFEALFNLCEAKFQLNKKSFSNKRSKEIVNYLKEALNYYSYEINPDYHIYLTAVLAENYRLLGHYQGVNWHNLKDKLLYINPKELFNDTINISRIRYLGEKYSMINSSYYSLNNDENAYLWYRIYDDLYRKKKDSIQITLKMIDDLYKKVVFKGQ